MHTHHTATITTDHKWDWLARELFFDSALDADTLTRYKARLKADSVVGIDVKDFLAELPSLKADPATGQAPWVQAVPRRLVVGTWVYVYKRPPHNQSPARLLPPTNQPITNQQAPNKTNWWTRRA